MDKCEILIVEDDGDMRQSWERDIREFNREAGAPFRFQATFAVSKREALRVLERTRIDCAVIDLRLPDGEGDESVSRPLGNDILRALLRSVGVPAFVYSGYDGEASEEVCASNIRVLGKKGGGGAEILQAFAEEADLMAAMEMTRTRIAEETARLFNKSIWKRWQDRWSTENREVIAGVIVRQTVSHIADSLGRPPENHHPEEFYVVPGVFEERLDTGDLLEFDGEVCVVLTPRCNMANKPPTHVTLAVCNVFAAWEQWKQDFVGGNAKQKERAERDLKSHANQGHEIASHFLPPLNGRGPWLVNFKEVRTVALDDVAALLGRRFATVAPPFVPNLVQRYSSYLGRIGQPDISADVLIGICRS